MRHRAAPTASPCCSPPHFFDSPSMDQVPKKQRAFRSKPWQHQHSPPIHCYWIPWAKLRVFTRWLWGCSPLTAGGQIRQILPVLTGHLTADIFTVPRTWACKVLGSMAASLSQPCSVRPCSTRAHALLLRAPHRSWRLILAVTFHKRIRQILTNYKIFPSSPTSPQEHHNK